MPLQYQDQVNLIKDILTNQQSDCCGSVSEYEQLERVIKSLMANNHVNQQDVQVLSQIYESYHYYRTRLTYQVQIRSSLSNPSLVG